MCSIFYYCVLLFMPEKNRWWWYFPYQMYSEREWHLHRNFLFTMHHIIFAVDERRAFMGLPIHKREIQCRMQHFSQPWAKASMRCYNQPLQPIFTKCQGSSCVYLRHCTSNASSRRSNQWIVSMPVHPTQTGAGGQLTTSYNEIIIVIDLRLQSCCSPLVSANLVSVWVI